MRPNLTELQPNMVGFGRFDFDDGKGYYEGVEINPLGEIVEWIDGKCQEPQVMPAPKPPASESPQLSEATCDDGTDMHCPSSHCPATLIEQ